MELNGPHRDATLHKAKNTLSVPLQETCAPLSTGVLRLTYVAAWISRSLLFTTEWGSRICVHHLSVQQLMDRGLFPVFTYHKQSCCMHLSKRLHGTYVLISLGWAPARGIAGNCQSMLSFIYDLGEDTISKHCPFYTRDSFLALCPLLD